MSEKVVTTGETLDQYELRTGLHKEVWDFYQDLVAFRPVVEKELSRGLFEGDPIAEADIPFEVLRRNACEIVDMVRMEQNPQTRDPFSMGIYNMKIEMWKGILMNVCQDMRELGRREAATPRSDRMIASIFNAREEDDGL